MLRNPAAPKEHPLLLLPPILDHFCGVKQQERPRGLRQEKQLAAAVGGNQVSHQGTARINVDGRLPAVQAVSQRPVGAALLGGAWS